jgi:hypothetical protein
MTHHLVASAIDHLRNEFSRAHPSLPSKSYLAKKVEELKALVEKLPDDVLPAAQPTAGQAKAASAAPAPATPVPAAPATGQTTPTETATPASA